MGSSRDCPRSLRSRPPRGVLGSGLRDRCGLRVPCCRGRRVGIGSESIGFRSRTVGGGPLTPAHCITTGWKGPLGVGGVQIRATRLCHLGESIYPRPEGNAETIPYRIQPRPPNVRRGCHLSLLGYHLPGILVAPLLDNLVPAVGARVRGGLSPPDIQAAPEENLTRSERTTG